MGLRSGGSGIQGLGHVSLHSGGLVARHTLAYVTDRCKFHRDFVSNGRLSGCGVVTNRISLVRFGLAALTSHIILPLDVIESFDLLRSIGRLIATANAHTTGLLSVLS